MMWLGIGGSIEARGGGGEAGYLPQNWQVREGFQEEVTPTWYLKDT